METTITAHRVEREALTIDEAAHALGIGRVTAYKLINRGELRRIKIGSRSLIPRSEVYRILNGTDDDDPAA